MSRIDQDGESAMPYELWEHNLRLALSGKRGQRALADLKAALLFLPQKRLIEDKLQSNREVCAVGAYAWFKKVKAGMDPIAAFDSMPELGGEDGTPAYETVDWGVNAGLTSTLAWQLAYMNDDQFGRMTPEERYDAFMVWIDKNLVADAVPA